MTRSNGHVHTFLHTYSPAFLFTALREYPYGSILEALRYLIAYHLDDGDESSQGPQLT